MIVLIIGTVVASLAGGYGTWSGVRWIIKTTQGDWDQAAIEQSNAMLVRAFERGKATQEKAHQEKAQKEHQKALDDAEARLMLRVAALHTARGTAFGPTLTEYLKDRDNNECAGV